MPLEPTSIKPIVSAIGGNVPKAVMHVQIERAERRKFGAYDNFQPGCGSFGDDVSQMVIEALVSEGVLEVITSEVRF